MSLKHDRIINDHNVNLLALYSSYSTKTVLWPSVYLRLPPGDFAKFAHDSLGGAVCLTQLFTRWPAMPIPCGDSTRARDSSVDSAHFDTATATQLHVDVADLALLLPAPCYCVIYSSVIDERWAVSRRTGLWLV